MLSLAQVYADENSAPFSKEQVEKWYRKSAENGNARAQRALGTIYELGHDSVPDYQKAALQGLAGAQTNLGNLYEDGRGVTKDYSQAVRCIKKPPSRDMPGRRSISANSTNRVMV